MDDVVVVGHVDAGLVHEEGDERGTVPQDGHQRDGRLATGAAQAQHRQVRHGRDQPVEVAEGQAGKREK